MASRRPCASALQGLGFCLTLASTIFPRVAFGAETEAGGTADSAAVEASSESNEAADAASADPTASEVVDETGKATAEPAPSTSDAVSSQTASPPEEDRPAIPEKKEPVDSSILTSIETPGEEDRRKKERPGTRFSEVGALVGMAVRPSSSDRFKYRPGIAYGGFFRPQITEYLAVRLAYREERIPVDAASGAYDYQGQSSGLDLSQPNLKVTNLGLRIEPSLALSKYVHLMGVLSWSWIRIVYPMPEADNFYQRSDRAGVELNWGLGGGISIDLLRNWLNLSLSGTYHFVSNQTGLAYDPVQAIVNGQITYFAPMARPKNLTDVLLTIGLIL